LAGGLARLALAGKPASKMELRMDLSSQEMLRRLGGGSSISSICAAAGISRTDFDTWWKTETAARVPSMIGARRAAVSRSVSIERNQWGIPSIFADSDEDLFFGFGYATAQDRLFQLDYLRRRGAGRLAEILGADGSELDLLARTVGFRNILELDLLARTVGIRHIAEREWTQLSEETRALITAFTAGINAHVEETRDRLPIEFDLLDYQPEPWSPVDCLTIEGEFRWYLTGRFPVIVIPELARRVLGESALYRAFLQVEADDESILPPGSYPLSRVGSEPVGVAAGDPQAGGSNNWVVAGKRMETGKPMVASDPHIPFDAVSWWYEVYLCGGSFNVAGMAYVGMPAVMFGRNERVAWGCTNNICSQRDLYQEKADPAHPKCFLHDGTWEPWREREEVIHVKGGGEVRKTIRYSRNGPVVDDVLPPPARSTRPVSLKWLGAYQGGWLTALLGMNRARSADDFRAATRPWHVPTFSVVFADVDGQIGYKAVGRIPIRKVWERGYRPGWDPEHQWDGLIPFEGMPGLANPVRGWLATANNRPAPEDFSYPLSGTWSDGLRARRIRQMLESSERLSREVFVAMHHDALSLRAQNCLPALLIVLESSADRRVREAASQLCSWDCRMEPDRVGATIFDVFFSHWTKAVVATRFAGDTAGLLAGGANGLAAALLTEDSAEWFTLGGREQAILTAMNSALAWLAQRLGPDMKQWTWGKLHLLPLRHILSGRGDLGRLLDHGNVSVKGDAQTVCNTGLGGLFEARAGANYRLIADMAMSPPGLWAVDCESSSGHPGSPHYGDQLRDWIDGRYHLLPLDRDAASAAAVSRLTLEPKG
jgi:penicillin amidase